MEPTTVVDRELIDETRTWVHDRDRELVSLINRVRTDLGRAFETDVDPVDTAQFNDEVDVVFDDIDRAVNVAALVDLLRRVDVAEDYPGFIIDEVLGRELAGLIAGEQPLRMLAEATFHYADASVHYEDGTSAGIDDLDAALAAGFQTRLPGWPWRGEPTPFE